MLRSIQWCVEGSNMHNDLKMTLEYVDELGRLKLANMLAEAANIGLQAPGSQRAKWWVSRGWTSWRCSSWPRPYDRARSHLQGRGWLGCRRVMAWHWLGTVWRRQQDTTMHVWCWYWAIPHHQSWGHCLAQTMARGASTDYEDPPHMSPPVFSGSAYDGGCIFVLTLGMPTPPLVHVEPTMSSSSSTPHEEAIQIE